MENAPGWPENASGRKRRPEQVPLTFKRLAISTIRFRVQIPERRAKAAQKPGNKNFMLKALAKNPSQWRISTTPQISTFPLPHFPAGTSNVMQQHRQQQQVN